LKYFFAIWFLRYLFDPLYTLSELPLAYGYPTGWLAYMPLAWYEAIHSFWGLLILKIAILACCIGVWSQRWRLQSAIAGCVLITTANAITRGFGHINHAELGPLLVTWVLTIFLTRLPKESISTPSTKPDQTAATGLITATLIISFVYSFVGIARVANGGIEFFVGDTLPNHMTQGSYSTWVLDHNISYWVKANPWMIVALKIGTVAVTVFEIAMPFCLVSRRLRFLTLLIMPGFHIGAILVFKVIFIEQALTMLLLINISPWLASQQKRSSADSISWLRFWQKLAIRRLNPAGN
jgi:hypothetical protein